MHAASCCQPRVQGTSLFGPNDTFCCPHPAPPPMQAEEYVEQLKAVPQLAALGPVFKTCAAVQVGPGGG